LREPARNRTWKSADGSERLLHKGVGDRIADRHTIESIADIVIRFVDLEPGPTRCVIAVECRTQTRNDQVLRQLKEDMSRDNNLDFQRFVDAQADPFELCTCRTESRSRGNTLQVVHIPPVGRAREIGACWRFSTRSTDEATAYLEHPWLGPGCSLCNRSSRSRTLEPTSFLGRLMK
jgi:hypothetical protein